MGDDSVHLFGSELETFDQLLLLMLELAHSLHITVYELLRCLDPLKILLTHLYIFLLALNRFNLFNTSLRLDNRLFRLQNSLQFVLLPLLNQLFPSISFVLCDLYLFHALLLKIYLRFDACLSDLDTSFLHNRFPLLLLPLHLVKFGFI